MPEELSRVTQERILLVGLGEIAKTHLAALTDIMSVTVIGGVDVAVREGIMFRGQPVHVYASLERAAADLTPTLVVVATPTATHAAVCESISQWFPDSAILVEKPIANNLADAQFLLTQQKHFPNLKVAYHFRHAPEVVWGLETVHQNLSDLGRIISARAVFADAYESDFDSAATRYGSSWLDSGIKALSVLSLFSHVSRRTSIRQLGEPGWSTFEGKFACQSDDDQFDATIVTSWHTTEAAKTTIIEYSSGAVLMMDHTGVAGYLFQNGRISDIFGTDGSVDRRYSHYVGLYRSYLSRGSRWRSHDDDLRLHEFLLAGP